MKGRSEPVVYTALQGEENQSTRGAAEPSGAPFARAVGGRFTFTFSSSPGAPHPKKKKKRGVRRVLGEVQ